LSAPSNVGIFGSLSFLAKDTLLYGFANAFSKLISVIVFPLLTRHFSVDSFGKIDILFALSNLMLIIFVFGQDSAVARFYYEYDKDETKQKEVVSWSLYIQLVVGFILLPILFYNADFISNKFTGTEDNVYLIFLILASVPFGIMINFSSNILKWTFKRGEFLMITMGSSITYLSLVALAIMFFDPTIIDIFYTYLLSRVIFSLIGFLYIKKYITPVKDYKIFKDLMHYAVPYGLICVIAAAIPSLDRYFIANKLDEFNLGIYAVGYKVASLLSYPVTAFQTAWGPFYLSIFKEKNIDQTFNEVLSVFSAVIFFLVLSVVLTSDIIVTTLASEKYLMSVPIVFPIVLSVAIIAIKDVSTIGIDLSMKTQYRLYSSLINLGTIVGFILLLIRPFGIMGVAYSLVLGSLIQIFFEVYTANKVNSIRFSFKSTLFLFFLVFISGLCVHLVDVSHGIFYVIAFRLLILSLFTILAILSIPRHLLTLLILQIKVRWKKK